MSNAEWVGPNDEWDEPVGNDDDEWFEPVGNDDDRTVRALLERRPPAFELTDTVRAALVCTDAIVATVISYSG